MESYKVDVERRYQHRKEHMSELTKDQFPKVQKEPPHTAEPPPFISNNEAANHLVVIDVASSHL